MSITLVIDNVYYFGYRQCLLLWQVLIDNVSYFGYRLFIALVIDNVYCFGDILVSCKVTPARGLLVSSILCRCLQR